MSTSPFSSSQKNLFQEEKYFFLIDSEHLQEINTHLYGFSIEDSGIFEDSNVDQWDQDRFHGVGTYIFIKRKPGQILISQDFNGSMGLYLYRSGDYYAVSNSFFMLIQYLEDKKPLTPDMDCMKCFLSSWLVNLSYQRTAIQEITLVPSLSELVLDFSEGPQIRYPDYRFNSVALDSPEGIQRLDNWYYKWIKVIRSIAAQTDELRVDLTGGFDSRLVFLFFLKSGIDLNKVYIRSINDQLHTHEEDYRIASSIAEKYGFSLNRAPSADEDVNYSAADVLNLSFHTKMLFHKELTFPSSFPRRKRYYFGGFGGETIRPYWDMDQETLIEHECSHITRLPDKTYQEYAGAVTRILTDSCQSLEEKCGPFDPVSNSCGFNMYRACRCRQHFGIINTEAYTLNTYKISPVMDPMIQQLCLNDEVCSDKNLLIALIFQRYCPDLLSIPFEGGRSFAQKTLTHAAELNEKYPLCPEPESEGWQFFIDTSSLDLVSDNQKLSPDAMNAFFLETFQSPAFRGRFAAYFGQTFYSYIESFIPRRNYFPLRHVYSAIACMTVMDAVVANRAILSVGFPASIENLSRSYSPTAPTGLGAGAPPIISRPKTPDEAFTLLDVFEGDRAAQEILPKVSVIVPIFNVKDYLEHALETLQKQTLREMEFICINDGSTDSSLEIVKRFAAADPRFVIADKKNAGYGVGMNVGLRLARGEYIGILEPDDFVPLDMFEDLYQAAKREDLDLVKADFYRFTTAEDGSMDLKYEHLDPTNRFYNQVLDPSQTPELIKLIMNTWSGIYKRSFLEAHSIRHNTTPGASFQDNGFFWQTFIYARRAMFLDKPYYMNRRDNPNSSVKSKDKVYAVNVEYDYIRDILLQDADIWERFKSYYYLKRFHNCMFTLTRISSQFKQEYVGRISAEFNRADALGELDFSAFTGAEKERLLFLMRDPKNFCLSVMENRSQYENILNSKTYRIGRMVTYIPRKIRDLLKKILRSGKR